MKKIFSFLLLGLLLSIGNAWGDQVTLAYSGSKTKNMTGNNDAALVGLDAAQWSVVAAKGNNNNYPGLNKAPDIRLYYADGGSNTITVSSLIGATISSITVAYTTDYENGKVLVGGNEVTGANGVYAINASSFVITNGNTSNVQVRFTSIIITYTGGSTPTSCLSPDISGTDNFFESTAITLSCGTAGASIYYTLDGTTPTSSSNLYSEPFNITATTTVKAIAIKGGLDDSEVAERTFTKATVLTVTDALTAIAALADNGTINDAYVSGIVCTAGSLSNSGQITYYISADGTETNRLQVYKGKGLNNANFTKASDIQVGDVVTIFGQLKKYVSNEVVTPEFNSGNYLVAFNRPAPAPYIDDIAAVDFGTVYQNALVADKTIEVTFGNLTGSITYSGLTSPFSATGTIVNSGDELTISANTATIGEYEQTLTIQSAADNKSVEVTITMNVVAAPVQKDYVWVLTDLASLTAEDVFVIVGDNGDTYALLNSNAASAAPTAVVINIASNVITDAVADEIQWTISGNATDGYTFYPKGSTTTWLYCTNTNNGVRVGTNDNKIFVVEGGYLKNSATSRYVGIYNSQDWRCYTTSSGNIAGQSFSYYKRVEGTNLTIGETGYATYYNSAKAYTMPENCVGNVFTVAGGLAEVYDEGDVVPAGEPLVIYTIDPGTKTLIFTDSDEDTYASLGLNSLKGSDAAELTTGGDVYYGLSLNSASQANSIGFYWMAAGGAAFTNGAHKAYLALGANQAPARYYLFNEESNATDIQNVEGTEKAVKFMENGKLYIQKNGVVYDAMGKTVR